MLWNYKMSQLSYKRSLNDIRILVTNLHEEIQDGHQTQDSAIGCSKCYHGAKPLHHGKAQCQLQESSNHSNEVHMWFSAATSVKNSENSWQVIVKTSNRSFINSNRSFPSLAGHDYEVIQTTDEMRNTTKNVLNLIQIYLT